MNPTMLQLIRQLHRSLEGPCPKTHAGLTKIIKEAGNEASALALKYAQRVQDLVMEHMELEFAAMPVAPLVAYGAIVAAAQACLDGAMQGIGRGVMEGLMGLTSDAMKEAIEQRAAEQLEEDKETGRA